MSHDHPFTGIVPSVVAAYRDYEGLSDTAQETLLRLAREVYSNAPTHAKNTTESLEQYLYHTLSELYCPDIPSSAQLNRWLADGRLDYVIQRLMPIVVERLDYFYWDRDIELRHELVWLGEERLERLLRNAYRSGVLYDRKGTPINYPLAYFRKALNHFLHRDVANRQQVKREVAGFDCDKVATFPSSGVWHQMHRIPPSFTIDVQIELERLRNPDEFDKRLEGWLELLFSLCHNDFERNLVKWRWDDGQACRRGPRHVEEVACLVDRDADTVRKHLRKMKRRYIINLKHLGEWQCPESWCDDAHITCGKWRCDLWTRLHDLNLPSHVVHARLNKVRTILKRQGKPRGEIEAMLGLPSFPRIDLPNDVGLPMLADTLF